MGKKNSLISSFFVLCCVLPCHLESVSRWFLLPAFEVQIIILLIFFFMDCIPGVQKITLKCSTGVPKQSIDLITWVVRLWTFF